MKKYIGIALVVAAVILIALSMKKSENTSLRIGVISALTGNAAYIGQSNMRGTEIGLLKVKETYPDLDVSLFHEDSQFNPKVGLDAYQKLKHTNDINALITMASNISVAVQPVAAQDNILHVAASTLANNFSTENDLSFRLTAKVDIEAPAAVAYMASQNFKKIGILYMNNEIGISLRDSIKKHIPNTSLSILVEEGVAPDQTDFRSQLIKLKASGVDAIYTATIAPQTAMVLNQAHELQITAQFISYRATEDPVLLKNAGILAENIVYTNVYDINDMSDVNQEFVKAYTEKYNEQPNGYAAEAYEAVRLIADAYVQCTGDTECTKTFMNGVKNRPSILGPITFDTFGDVSYPFFLKTVKGGKFVKVK